MAYNDLEQKNKDLKTIMHDTIELIDNIVLGVRAILYITTVGYLWFYLDQKQVAIGVVISLVIAHLTVCAREELSKKKAELDKI